MKKNSALLTGLLAIAAAAPLSAMQPLPDRSLVIFEGSHQFGEWNKLAVNPAANSEFQEFLTSTPSADYNYFIHAEFSDISTVQIGTNFGRFDGEEYTETGGASSFRTYVDWNAEYSDVLIMKSLVDDLNNGRYLQFNQGGGTLTKVEIVARPVEADTPEKQETSTIFRFSGSNEATDYTVSAVNDPDNGYWQSGNNNYTFNLPASFLSDIDLSGLAAGDKVVLNLNYYNGGAIDIKSGDTGLSYELRNYNNSEDFDVQADITLSDETITSLMANGLSIKAVYINIKSIDIVSKGTIDFDGKPQPEQPEYELIDLFVPGVYPEGLDWSKSAYGTVEKEGIVPSLHRYYGTGIFVSNDAPYGQTDMSTVYRFADEWWIESQLTDDNPIKQQWASDLKELNSYPLRLTRGNTPNMRRLKRDDEIVIGVTLRSDETNPDEWAKTSQAQYGTYDYSTVEGEINYEDPYCGFFSFTDYDNGEGQARNYADWGVNNVGEKRELVFKVDHELLDAITRYGLTINGRRYDLNYVKARIYDEENTEEITGNDRDQHEYFFNTTFPINNLNAGDIIIMTINNGNLYNEHVTQKYDSNSVYLGSVTEHSEEPQALPEGDDSEFEVQIMFTDLDGEKQRIHRAAFLKEEHFVDPSVQPATFAVDASDLDSNKNDVIYELGFKGNTVDKGTSKEIHLTIDNPNIVEALNKNGIQLRGKLYSLGNGDIQTSVGNVSIDNADAPVEIYNVMGIRVSEMKAGNVYIIRQGDSVKKVIR